jgi:hypothetical protein
VEVAVDVSMDVSTDVSADVPVDTDADAGVDIAETALAKDFIMMATTFGQTRAACQTPAG